MTGATPSNSVPLRDDRSAVLPPRLDLLDSGFLKNPYPVYERLRRAEVARAGPATWAVTRYAQVAALLRDERLGHMGAGDIEQRFSKSLFAEPAGELPGLRNLVSSMSPPDHTRVRLLLAKALNQVRGRGSDDLLKNHIAELVADTLQRGRFDAVADFAQPLQIRFISRLLGIPEADRPALFHQAVELGRRVILFPFAYGRSDAPEVNAEWVRNSLANLVEQRRCTPGDDLISTTLSIREGDSRLSEDEIIDNAVFLCFAGFETTIYVIANMLATLACRPDQWKRLRENPALVPAAVDEILRFDAPLQWVSRVTVRPIEIAGHTLNKGRLVLLLLGSANRDERQFSRPDELDIARHPNRHLTFGGGAHQCMALVWVRMTAAMVMTQFLERCSHLELEEEPLRRLHPNIRSYETVRVIARAA